MKELFVNTLIWIAIILIPLFILFGIAVALMHKPMLVIYILFIVFLIAFGVRLSKDHPIYKTKSK